jgi:2-dehydro-3-deoxyglucarate aldolase/4-hydroxy-2-oxoheptanedioate aldolase
MKHNRVKRKLKRGEVSLGTMVFEFDSPGVARLCELAGAEWVIFDMEHTRFSMARIGDLMGWSHGCDIVPLVRASSSGELEIRRPMDAGSMGIMVPMVETAQQAIEIVNAVKYMPAGKRGTAFGIAHDRYETGDILRTMQSSNRESMIIAQIESEKGVENVDEIAAVKEIDVVWVGHFDLTQSMGIPGEFTHPKFQAAMDRVADAARKNGKTAGRLVGTVEEAKTWVDRGYRMLCYSRDTELLQRALREGLSEVREHLK